MDIEITTSDPQSIWDSREAIREALEAAGFMVGHITVTARDEDEEN